MPGQFNPSESDDGLVASTSNSAKSGVFGRNDSTQAAVGPGGAGVFGLTVSLGAAGVFGANNANLGVGVQGNGPEVGVSGFSPAGSGVRGITQGSGNFAVFGRNDATQAPTGGGAGGAGVFGLTNCPGAAGVFGANNGAQGVGVQGNGPDAGVSGFSAGVQGLGVSGKVSGAEGTAVYAEHGGPGGGGLALHALHGGGGTAGLFEGNVTITGDLQVNGDIVLPARAADCAECFDVAAGSGPGTVMVIGPGGELAPCARAYDRGAAGVVSGAGDLRPGLILDGPPAGPGRRLPVALVGKVVCKVDARHGAIAVGDLLTTSPTPGHAMKASDPQRAFGAVIGKAIEPFEAGLGQIRILVALQ